MTIDLKMLRAPERPVRPTQEALIWWNGLAPEDRPVEIPKRFTRIFNKLAVVWSDDVKWNNYMTELVIETERLNRQGFPFAVVLELLALRELRLKLKGETGLPEPETFTFSTTPGRR